MADQETLSPETEDTLPQESGGVVSVHEAHQQAPAPVHSPETGLLGVIERMVASDVDITKIEALLKMRAEEEDRQRRIEREDRDDMARRAFLSAFAKVQGEVGPILRNKKNEHTRSAYATLEAIEKAVSPILAANGFSTTCVPVPCELEGHIRMRLTLGHAEGHEKVYEDDFPLDKTGSGGKVNKTDIQAKGSTQTYARRYLKASALDLAFMDDNDGNATKNVPTISEERFMDLRYAIEKAGINEDVILEAENIPSLDQLPANLFNAVMNGVKATAKKKGIEL